MRVYSTTLLAEGATALLFLIVCLSFLHPIGGFVGYGEHPWYMGMMLIGKVAMDAFKLFLLLICDIRNAPLSSLH